MNLIYDEDNLEKLIKDLSKQIKKKLEDNSDLAMIGILPYGYPLAKRLQKLLKLKHPIGQLDIELYRDDIHKQNEFITIRKSDIPFKLKNKNILLVSDILHHGQTVRAALNAIYDIGIPNSIQLVILFDRGNRKLPIQPNYTGKQIKLEQNSHLKLSLYEIDGHDSVHIVSTKTID